MSKKPQPNFLRELGIYVGRVSEFDRTDWIVYVLWIGMMIGLFVTVFGFMAIGRSSGVTYPIVAWSVPIGIAVFVVSIAIDTIGHRTIYKEEISKGENLVHHVTIAAGVTSIILLCVGYNYPNEVRYPAITLLILSVFYSVIDEAFHWRRYITQHSDRVEMWSHFGIFLGHIIMILSWWRWFEDGYPGAAETFAVIQKWIGLV